MTGDDIDFLLADLRSANERLGRATWNVIKTSQGLNDTALVDALHEQENAAIHYKASLALMEMRIRGARLEANKIIDEGRQVLSNVQVKA